MLIGLPNPGIQLIQTVTLKIQGKEHGWGQNSQSQYESNILSISIPLVPCHSALPFMGYSIFKIWPWKSKVKVIAQGHKVGKTPDRLISLSFYVDRLSHSLGTVISKFDIENLRSRSGVRSRLKVTTWVQHSVDSQPYVPCQFGIPFLGYDFFKSCPWKSRLSVMDEVTVSKS